MSPCHCCYCLHVERRLDDAAHSGMALPTVSEDMGRTQPIDLPLLARVKRFLRWCFARPVLDHRGRPCR